MSRKKPNRIQTSESTETLQHTAFANLNLNGLPLSHGHDSDAAPRSPERGPEGSNPPPPRAIGGRLDVKREKSGRGGKTVTVIYAFPGMATAMKESILRLLKKSLATGGTLSHGNIEIQGDFADRVVEILCAQGYRAIRAGG